MKTKLTDKQREVLYKLFRCYTNYVIMKCEPGTQHGFSYLQDVAKATVKVILEFSDIAKEVKGMDASVITKIFERAGKEALKDES